MDRHDYCRNTMTLEEVPTEEDALDGLNAAVRYCENQGWDETAKEIGELYQRVGELADQESD